MRTYIWIPILVWLAVTKEAVTCTCQKVERADCCCPHPDCGSIYRSGVHQSGVYWLRPYDNKGGFWAYCDMLTDGGGWTVFQRRKDGSVDFYRGWEEYKEGFGYPNSEHWLGNEFLHRLTGQRLYALRVDLRDGNGTEAYSKSSLFKISDEAEKYKLTLGDYSGTAGGPMTGNGKPFTTKDRDNDDHAGNCATMYKGAWWYTKCHATNLNGRYYNGPHDSYADGVNYQQFRGYHYSLPFTEMKIRPVDF
ncbi:fibrinogen C domain-containing protein 1-B [Lingula anatina]|uniref:Fibrinogen C domain-containing protein 1-B n=1 Tax=Lingula anatina TaxID=7574 RepID=A0A1S3I200_LINAN|nr:fibrinogen C domain-containing protein 1-B [Lingula anatina]|eukprot:XP_013391856.1 fibrinogen C domain-containing protein 1-B [Lingula anatina]